MCQVYRIHTNIKGLTEVAKMLYNLSPHHILGRTIDTQGKSFYLPWAHCDHSLYSVLFVSFEVM